MPSRRTPVSVGGGVTETYYDYKYSALNSEEDILGLMDEDYDELKPNEFRVIDEIDSQETLEAFGHVLLHFKEHNVVWEDLRVTFCHSGEHYARLFLRAATTLDLFKNITLGFTCEADETYDFFSQITWGPRVEKIGLIIDGDMSEGDNVALSRILRANNPCLKQLYLIVDNMAELGEESETHLDQNLVRGLTQNKTLEVLKIQCNCDNFRDEQMALIVKSQVKNPKLKFLDVFNYMGYGESTSKQIARLLKTSKTIKQLSFTCVEEVFHYAYSDAWLETDIILPALKKSQTLQKLDLTHSLHIKHIEDTNDGDILERLFRILPDCPSLTQIFLSGKNNVQEESLEKLMEMPRLPRPIFLQIMGTKGGADIVRKLLLKHPEVTLNVIDLEDVDPMSSDWVNEMWKIPDDKRPEIEYLSELNANGRFLLDRKNVPVSLWPHILGRISDEPSMLYEFMKGPAWRDRDPSLVSSSKESSKKKTSAEGPAKRKAGKKKASGTRKRRK